MRNRFVTCRAPAQVAVSNTGDVFVADGYCNSRVAQFRADGSYIREFKLPRVRGNRQQLI